MASELDVRIEGRSLDLFDNEEDRFNLTKQIHDLTNLETRNAEFSKTISVPLTGHNREILGENLPAIDRFSPNPVAGIPCDVLIKGIPVVGDGLILIGNQDKKSDTVSITIIGGTANFFSQLSSDSISTLEFAELDLDWSLASVANIASVTTGITFARSIWYTNKSRRQFVEDGGDDTDTKLDKVELGESGFFMFLHTVMNKIFSGLIGITVDTSLMDEDYNIAAFSVGVPIVHESFESVNGFFAEVSEMEPFQDFLELQDITIDYLVVKSDNDLLWDATTNQFIIKEDGFSSISANGYVAIDTFNSSYFASIFINGVEVLAVFVYCATGGDYYPFSVTTTASLVIGDTVEIVIQVQKGIGRGLFGQGVFSVESSGSGRGRFVNVNSLLPEFSQRDFVKEVFKLYNIIPTEKNGIITLRYFKDIAANEPITLEFDQLKERSQRTTIFSYGQKNHMKFADNDFVERKDTSSEFLLNSQTLEKEVIKIDSKFSATDNDEISFPESGRGCVIPNYELIWNFVNDNKMHVNSGTLRYRTTERNDIKSGDFISVSGERRRVMNVVDDFEGDVDVSFSSTLNDQNWNHWLYEANDLQSHIVEIYQTTGETNEVWDGGNSQTYPNTNVAQPNIRWSNLQRDYYQLLVDSVFKPFIIVGWMNFNTLKYISIDGMQPIYIEEYNAYFYANKIEQWKTDGACRVEMIELKI